MNKTIQGNIFTGDLASEKMVAVMATAAADQPTIWFNSINSTPNVGLFTEFPRSKNKLSVLTGFIDGPLVTTFKLQLH